MWARLGGRHPQLGNVKDLFASLRRQMYIVEEQREEQGSKVKVYKVGPRAKAEIVESQFRCVHPATTTCWWWCRCCCCRRRCCCTTTSCCSYCPLWPLACLRRVELKSRPRVLHRLPALRPLCRLFMGSVFGQAIDQASFDSYKELLHEGTAAASSAAAEAAEAAA